MQKRELENLLKRVQADFDNYRKRVEQERLEIKKSANADLILSLLPVLDNFKRAAEHAPTDDQWSTGIKAIERQFEEILNQQGLSIIEVKPGDTVNPNHHEIVSQEKTQKYEQGSIVQVVAPGYVLNAKILRPAKVVVAN